VRDDMADIELIIDIPEEKYNMIKNKTYCGIYDVEVYEAIANGTPLPKGHGDLKDMGNLPYVFDLTREDSIYSGKDIERAIKSMKTIIEADKER
jgi:hypothetical protein